MENNNCNCKIITGLFCENCKKIRKKNTSKKYYDNNKDKYKEYYQLNKIKRQIYRKEYYLYYIKPNKDKIKHNLSAKKYRDNNKHKIEEYRKNIVKDLKDDYIKVLLKSQKITISNEHIEEKILQLKIKRKIKELKTKLK